MKVIGKQINNTDGDVSSTATAATTISAIGSTGRKKALARKSTVTELSMKVNGRTVFDMDKASSC